MHITVKDEIVSENILSFLGQLRRMEATREKKGAAFVQKTHTAYINRTSGRIIFLEDLKEKQDFSERDWKPLYLDYSYDSDSDCFHANAYGDENRKEAFQLNDLHATAFTVLKTTMVILNRLSDLVKGSGSDLITKIKTLCKLDVEVGQFEKGKNLIYATWHAVNRNGAEKLLRGKAPGTFLFREDYFAKLLADQLSDQMGKSVRCVTLSILAEENHICEFTLVHIDHQWRWYDDALFCNVQGFAEVEDLLNTQFKDKARIPFYNKLIEQEKLAQ